MSAFRFRIIFFFIIFCLSTWQSSYSQPDDPNVLQVEIHQGKTSHTISATIRNISNKKLEYWSRDCSYWENWETDNRAVSIPPWGCRSGNLLGIKSLEPGQSQVFELPIIIDPKLHEDLMVLPESNELFDIRHKTLSEDSELKNSSSESFIVFRMIFTPIQSEANQITLYKRSFENNESKNSPFLKGSFWSNEIKIDTSQ